MKITSSDIVAILRLFHQGDDMLKPRSIEQLKVSHPTPHTTLASFRCLKQVYYVIFDVTAEDNINYLFEFVAAEKSDVVGDFIENPRDELTSYALPFKGKEVYIFKQKTTKVRLDQYLGETYPDISRSTWQKYIKAGYVNVDGEVILSPKRDITSTAVVTVHIPDATDYSDNTLPIIYIDENVIVINKPIGVLTHAKGALNDEFTVADFFRRYTSYNLDTNRPGIVHRLDRDTSGIIMGARNAETATMLQKQFADRHVKKTYLAVTAGILKEKEAQIELPIERNPSEPSTFRVGAKGKPASTRYKVLAETDRLSLVELSPLTGRTHQLRVHMAYLNSPIYGDRVYGKSADRLYLHAKQLEITIPIGERKTFSAPVPQDFLTLFPDIVA